MRIVRHFFTWFLLFCVSFLSATALFFYIYGKSILEEQLTALLGHKITIVKIRYHFPWGFRVDNFSVGSSIQIPRVVFYVNPVDLLKKKVTITDMKVHNPTVVLNSSQEDGSQLQLEKQQFEQFWSDLKQPYNEKNFQFSIQHIEIKNLNFQTHLTLWNEKRTVECLGTWVTFNDFQWPFKHGDEADFQATGNLKIKGMPLYSDFRMSAVGLWALSDDRFYSDINIVSIEKDLDLLLKVNASNSLLNVQGKASFKDLLNHINFPMKSLESVINEAAFIKDNEVITDFNFETPIDNIQIDKVNFSIEVKNSQTPKQVQKGS